MTLYSLANLSASSCTSVLCSKMQYFKELPVLQNEIFFNINTGKMLRHKTSGQNLHQFPASLSLTLIFYFVHLQWKSEGIFVHYSQMRCVTPDANP